MTEDYTSSFESDEYGFLIGLSQVRSKVTDIEKEIEKILAILKDRRSFINYENHMNRELNTIQKRVIDVIEQLEDEFQPKRSDATQQLNKDSPDQKNLSPAKHTHQADTTITDNITSSKRVRDKKGRFISSSDSKNKDQNSMFSVLGKIKSSFHQLSGTDSRGIDPTLDAIGEVKDTLSPIKNIANTAIKPLSGIMKTRKKNEPISREQESHNSRVLSYLTQILRHSGNGISLFGMVRLLPMLAVAIGGAVTAGLIAWWKGDKAVDDTTMNNTTSLNSKGNAVGMTSNNSVGKNASNTLSSGISQINPTQKQRDTIKDSYDSAKQAGFSHGQAVALVGENGRENGFRQDLMFGSHNDPARGQNLGIFSWQGERREKLVKHLSDKGLMNKDGTIVRSKEALTAQYEFAKLEMENNPNWKQSFLDKKVIGNDEARSVLGGKGSYIGWARGQDTIRRADGVRIPFDWRKHEATANGYSKIADEVSKSTVYKQPLIANSGFKASNDNQKTFSTSQIKTNTVAMPIQTNASKNFHIGVTKLPETDKVKTIMTSKNAKPVIVQNTSNNIKIGQNVGDLNLANIFAGGLGMDHQAK